MLLIDPTIVPEVGKVSFRGGGGGGGGAGGGGHSPPLESLLPPLE